MLSLNFVLLLISAFAYAFAFPQASDPPTCTDGGTLYCCQATLSGGLGPIVAVSDLLCYDLTPAVVNCIITDAPSDPVSGCLGTYSCCQVTDLAPAVALFCSKPPGNCYGSEGDGQCTDLIDGRFGNCSRQNIAAIRQDLGLE